MPTPFDLMVAPNGARLTQADHPALPISTAEVVAAAQACEAAGATSIHAHVRDHENRHTLDATRYNGLHAALAAATDLRIQVSTEAAGVFEVPAQRACLGAVTARDASVALREIARAPELVADTYALAARRGISVQHILYAPEDMEILRAHMDAGILSEDAPRALFVLGRYTPGQVSAPADLEPFLQAMGALKLTWSVCAFGPGEHACLLAALNAGGQVRVGFENNRTAPNGQPFRDNAASVAALVEAAAKQGFVPEKRALL